MILLIPLFLTACKSSSFLKSKTQQFGESDYYIDLWGKDDIVNKIKLSGITNKNALYIDSHGFGSYGYFVLRPDNRILGKFQPTPWYRIKDLSKVLGTNSTNIHNIYFAACNLKGTFDVKEVREYFPNATNIVHVPRGYKGNSENFIAAITLSMEEANLESFEPEFAPLISELFLPNSKKPYKTLISNKSILKP